MATPSIPEVSLIVKVSIVQIGATSYQKYDVADTYFLRDLSTGAEYQFPTAGKRWGFISVMRALDEAREVA